MKPGIFFSSILLSHGLFLLFLLLTHYLPSVEAAIKILTWGEKCVAPVPGEYIRPQDGECDLGRGLLCQTYTQGSYCGCHIGSVFTWDKQSKECRRKVTAVCEYDDSEGAEWKTLAFSRKCHDRASCQKVNWTAITGKRNNDDTRICLCRPGFQAAEDSSECRDMFSSKTLSVASTKDVAFLLFLMMGLVYICRII